MVVAPHNLAKATQPFSESEKLSVLVKPGPVTSRGVERADSKPIVDPWTSRPARDDVEDMVSAGIACPPDVFIG